MNIKKLSISGKHRSFKKPAVPAWAPKIGAALVIFAMIGAVIVSMLSGGSDKKPVNKSYPTSVAAPVTKTPKASPTPSKEPSASPTPKVEQSSEAPSPTQTPRASESPITEAPSFQPTPKPSATSVSVKKSPAEKAQQAVIEIIEQQNMTWDVYKGEFTFPYEDPKQQDMKGLLQRVRDHRPERAGFNLAGLYLGANKQVITDRLNNAANACKGKNTLTCKKIQAVVKVDLDFIQKAETLSGKYQEALKTSGLTEAQKQVWPAYNTAAVQFLNNRWNAVKTN